MLIFLKRGISGKMICKTPRVCRKLLIHVQQNLIFVSFVFVFVFCKNSK